MTLLERAQVGPRNEPYLKGASMRSPEDTTTLLKAIRYIFKYLDGLEGHEALLKARDEIYSVAVNGVIKEGPAVAHKG